MAVTDPWFVSDIRALVGRFCQLNCFQEALLPVLQHEHGCEPESFSILRMIGWNDIARALASGLSPGLFGGLDPDDMSDLYEISWCEAPRGSNARQRLGHLAAAGPPICHVDRFYVPADRQWFARAHSVHSILVVAAGTEGIMYSDADHPHDPAAMTWPDVERALLRLEDGEPMFARAVAECRGLDPADRSRLRTRYLHDLAATLQTPTEVVADVLNAVIGRLGHMNADGAERDVAGVEAAAFLNAIAKSMHAGADIVAHEGVDESGATVTDSYGRCLDRCVTRALSFAETRRPRHLERLHEAAVAFLARWKADEPRRWYEAAQALTAQL